MVARHDAEGFGHCSNHGECEAVCPKGISIDFIALLNNDLRTSLFRGLGAVTEVEFPGRHGSGLASGGTVSANPPIVALPPSHFRRAGNAPI